MFPQTPVGLLEVAVARPLVAFLSAIQSTSRLRSVRQSSLFRLAPDQWSHCPPSECDLNLT